eukprot:3768329-Pyramimonas_sp.AAC.1
MGSEGAWDQDPDWSTILGLVHETLQVGLWKAAAEHHNGRGLEEGADTTALLSHMRALERKGAYKLRGGLANLSTAGFWSLCRLEQAGVKIESNLCRRCQRCPETDFHTVWECLGNSLIEECQGSNHLADQAKAGYVAHPCYWLRGLIPAAWTRLTEPTDDLQCNLDP